MKFELRRTTAEGPRQTERLPEAAAAVDEGLGVLRRTDALSRRPGALRARSRTYVQPMGATISRSRQRVG